MNALEAKARQEHFAALVAGDPIGVKSSPPRPLDIVLGNQQAVNLDEVAKALGGLDLNRVAHHLLARGYAPSEADPSVFDRSPWYSRAWPDPVAGIRGKQ
jgi:hypothetical protein